MQCRTAHTLVNLDKPYSSTCWSPAMKAWLCQLWLFTIGLVDKNIHPFIPTTFHTA